MDAGVLLLVNLQRGKAQGVFHHALVHVEPGIGAAGHDVGGHPVAGVDFAHGLLQQTEGIALEVHLGAGGVGLQHLGIQPALLGGGADDLDALVGALVGHAAHVGGDPGLLGQNVVGRGAFGHGEGAGGTHHGARQRVHTGQQEAEQRLKQPQVAQQHPHAEAHVGGQALEHLPQGGGEAGLEGAVPVGLADELGQLHQRGVGAGGTGMAAGGVGGELHIRVALFHHAHHGVAALDSGHGGIHDHAALVQQQAQMDPLLLEPGSNGGRTVAAPFLGAAGGQIHVALGLPALGQQLLHRLHEAEQAALGVHGAAAPYRTLGDLAGEGRVLPLALSGHHIVVAHDQDGRACAAVQTGDFINQAAVEHGAGGCLVHQRELLPQQLVEGLELAAADLVLFRHGLALHQRGKGFGIPLCPLQIGIRKLSSGGRGGLHLYGTGGSNAQQNQKNENENEHDP